jgi:hypothetical protein
MFATSRDARGPRIMSPDDYPSAARSFRAVFHVFDPYGSPFQPTVPARLIVYARPAEANPWGLNDADLGSLVAAADDGDLERVFVSLADPQRSEPDEGHYVLRPLSVESYTRTHPREAWPIVPHAIYPPSGHWGAISSDESHVLVGGSRRFIDDLQAGLGRSQDEMVAAWLEEWSDRQDRDPGGELRIGDWIPAQLAHVVGPERAEALLSASRLRRWDLPPH